MAGRARRGRARPRGARARQAQGAPAAGARRSSWPPTASARRSSASRTLVLGGAEREGDPLRVRGRGARPLGAQAELPRARPALRQADAAGGRGRGGARRRSARPRRCATAARSGVIDRRRGAPARRRRRADGAPAARGLPGGARRARTRWRSTWSSTTSCCREGLAREVVHAIQNARKAAGLNVEDRIALTLGGDDELLDAVRAHEEYVTGETLATSLVLRRRATATQPRRDRGTILEHRRHSRLKRRNLPAPGQGGSNVDADSFLVRAGRRGGDCRRLRDGGRARDGPSGAVVLAGGASVGQSERGRGERGVGARRRRSRPATRTATSTSSTTAARPTPASARSRPGRTAAARRSSSSPTRARSSPAYVTGHPSASCVTTTGSVTGLQHDAEATPKGGQILNTTNPAAAGGDAQLLVDATDANGRCHDQGVLGQQAPRGGLEILDITDPAQPKEIGLTVHVGEAHTVNIDPKRPHIAIVSSSDSLDVGRGRQARERDGGHGARRHRDRRHVVVHELPGRHVAPAEARRLRPAGLPLPLPAGRHGQLARVPEAGRRLPRDRDLPGRHARLREPDLDDPVRPEGRVRRPRHADRLHRRQAARHAAAVQPARDRPPPRRRSRPARRWSTASTARSTAPRRA